jgi:hypothetical protein
MTKIKWLMLFRENFYYVFLTHKYFLRAKRSVAERCLQSGPKSFIITFDLLSYLENSPNW